ncbi:AP2-like ethylene-responsive transcription factor PLT1, partial [Tetrabaena socialis]
CHLDHSLIDEVATTGAGGGGGGGCPLLANNPFDPAADAACASGSPLPSGAHPYPYAHHLQPPPTASLDHQPDPTVDRLLSMGSADLCLLDRLFVPEGLDQALATTSAPGAGLAGSPGLNESRLQKQAQQAQTNKTAISTSTSSTPSTNNLYTIRPILILLIISSSKSSMATPTSPTSNTLTWTITTRHPPTLSACGHRRPSPLTPPAAMDHQGSPGYNGTPAEHQQHQHQHHQQQHHQQQQQQEQPAYATRHSTAGAGPSAALPHDGGGHAAAPWYGAAAEPQQHMPPQQQQQLEMRQHQQRLPPQQQPGRQAHALIPQQIELHGQLSPRPQHPYGNHDFQQAQAQALRLPQPASEPIVRTQLPAAPPADYGRQRQTSAMSVISDGGVVLLDLLAYGGDAGGTADMPCARGGGGGLYGGGGVDTEVHGATMALTVNWDDDGGGSINGSHARMPAATAAAAASFGGSGDGRLFSSGGGGGGMGDGGMPGPGLALPARAPRRRHLRVHTRTGLNGVREDGGKTSLPNGRSAQGFRDDALAAADVGATAIGGGAAAIQAATARTRAPKRNATFMALAPFSGSGGGEADASVEAPTGTVAVEEGAAAAKEHDGAAQRSSCYRGVTRHRRSGRWEAHLWVKSIGRQVYLGGYEEEAHAAEAFDVVALKCKGPRAVRTNFPLPRYLGLLAALEAVSLDELIMAVRRQSQGFSRGSSAFRGVTAHPSGRWESRIGIPGSKHIYLGLFGQERQAAAAYDRSLVRLRGAAAATNFPMGEYRRELAEYHAVQQASTARGLLLLDAHMLPLTRPGPELEKWVKAGFRAFPHLAAEAAATDPEADMLEASAAVKAAVGPAADIGAGASIDTCSLSPMEAVLAIAAAAAAAAAATMAASAEVAAAGDAAV